MRKRKPNKYKLKDYKLNSIGSSLTLFRKYNAVDHWGDSFDKTPGAKKPTFSFVRTMPREWDGNTALFRCRQTGQETELPYITTEQ